MVFYSIQADNDLDEILEGLLTWRKHTLSREFCLSYISDLVDVCDSLDTKIIHFNTVYETHKRWGDKVHKYERNRSTTWYIIYDIDLSNNVFINKIISNYLTVS
jgi:hypothetical protein